MFALSYAVGLSGAMSPGPLTVLTVSETVRRGLSAPFLIMAGHAALELFATTVLSLGLLAIAGNNTFIGAIGLTGGTAMFVLGTIMIRSALFTSVSTATKMKNTGEGKIRLVGTGIIMSLSNPYWTVWWVTVASGLLVTAAKTGISTVAAFYIGHILADFSYYVVLGLLVHAGRRHIGGKIYRLIMAILALAMSVFGIMFALNGWTTFSTP